MREWNHYRPKEFTSDEGLEPLNPAEMAAEAPIPAPLVDTSVEKREGSKPENVFSRGEERFQKVGAALSSMKEGMRGFFNKIPEMARATAVGALSTPELVASGLDRVSEFGTKKNQEFSAFLSEKAEAASAVAGLASNFSAEKAAQAREGINNGLRTVTGWGERSLAFAENKRLEAIHAFHDKIAQAKLAHLEREHEAASREYQVAAERVAVIRGKLGLRDELAAFQPMAMAA